MFEIIETQYDFSEKIICRIFSATEKEVSDLARSYKDKHKALRVFWRTKPTVLMEFHDVEQRVIEHALHEIFQQDIALNVCNLVDEVERILIEESEKENVPWIGPDLLVSTLTKLDHLTENKKRQLLNEYTYGL